jgi:hypothetical protein
MAIIKYPDWLPLAQRASKNLTQQTPFRSDQPAVGAPIFQKLTTDIAATWSLTWVFTLAEERAFIQWLRSPNYLNKANNWFTMMIDLGGSGLQEQTLHFTDYPVQTSIDGGVVTWTGNVIAKKLNNTMDEFDDVLVELDYRWYSWLDEVVNRDLPQVYMTPILHMPINMLSPTLDSRIIYDGPQVYYINRNGNLVQSAINEWPLTFIDGVAVGRVPPEVSVTNRFLYSSNFSSSNWSEGLVSVLVSETGVLTAASTYDVTATATRGNHLINQTVDVSVGVGDKVTFSFFAKANGYNFIRIYVRELPTVLGSAIVDLRDGSIYSGPGGTYVTDVGGGWFRISETITATKDKTMRIRMDAWIYSDGVTGSFTGDGVSGIKLSAATVEVNQNTTSPIITSASPVTRPAASAKVVMNGATSIDITYSDGSVINAQAVDDYATIPQADSAWGSKYITTIKFNV